MAEKKAYSYTYSNGDYMDIVWADTANQARKYAADESGERYIDIHVYREPWADKYSEVGKIPPEVLWDQGWWLPCCRCEREYVEPDCGQIIDGQVYCDECAAEILEAGKGGKQ